MTLRFVLGLSIVAVQSLGGQERGATDPRPGPAVTRGVVGRTSEGVDVESYTLRGSGGAVARVLTFGAILADLRVPDGRGRLTGVVRETVVSDAGFARGFAQAGAVMGRVANRISNARFVLDGAEYRLAANDGPHHLHGGRRGFNRVVWRAHVPDVTVPAVQLTYLSPDGEEGYPGTVSVTVTYTLVDPATLRLDYRATTDRATPFNLTHHAYFNLSGGGNVESHEVEIAADRVAQTDDDRIPDGRLVSVEGTPYDFRRPTPLGARAARLDRRSRYDHSYVLNAAPGGEALRFAARVFDPTSARLLEVWTTEPTVQLFTSPLGAVPNSPAAGYFCLETQHLPDSINRPEFPSIVLRPGVTFESVTEYRFSMRAPDSAP